MAKTRTRRGDAEKPDSGDTITAASGESMEIMERPRKISIDVPMAEPTADEIKESYQANPSHVSTVHVTHLTPRQNRAWCYLYVGAHREQLRLSAMKPVATQQDVIRWLLDRLADEFGIDDED